MTTEDDFQARLDVEPDNHVVRLVFADWLEERGDPRAEGYRALGVRRQIVEVVWYEAYIRSTWWIADNSHQRDHFLPRDWWQTVDIRPHFVFSHAKDFASRKFAEDAAALAFAKLPPERRAELLSTNTSEVTA